MDILNNSVPQIFSWIDPGNTGACGWVVIDSLVNGLAAGGLFIHAEATLEEVSDLAKSMSYKNTLLDPIVGGAKAGIRFDHQDPRALSVIRRFLLEHKFLLENFWYTGADLNTSNDFIFDVIEQDLKLPSVFYSLGKMLNQSFSIADQSGFLRQRLSSIVSNGFTLESCSTGYSVAAAIKLLSFKRKPRVLIQGFGAVGSSLHYFLQAQNIATVVGIADVDGFILHPVGIPIESLNAKDTDRTGSILSQVDRTQHHWFPRRDFETDEAFLSRFLSSQTAEIFSPCATRYQVTQDVANTLLSKTFIDAPVDQCFVVSGANNAFYSESVRMFLEKHGAQILPEWVSNSGTSILFMESMKEISANVDWSRYLLSVIESRLRLFVDTKKTSIKKTLYENCVALAAQRLNEAKIKNKQVVERKILESTL